MNLALCDSVLEILFVIITASAYAKDFPPLLFILRKLDAKGKHEN